MFTPYEAVSCKSTICNVLTSVCKRSGANLIDRTSIHTLKVTETKPDMLKHFKLFSSRFEFLSQILI